MQIDRKKVENYAKKDRNQTRFRSRRGNLPPRVKVGATQLAAFKIDVSLPRSVSFMRGSPII